ncbi:alpha/beta hydrolase [Natronolimnobius sp. AArcel1]|uniref:alpha/beta fold hydrolase n=1 Tax=Natronolimnobius sp. AArcel1 TaxID=1679093 RepID=UPI0013EB5073|nr:alpha/beta hydrolase [Natronolimnobius sp. AArcel1]NGM69342.1 alpha/beta hydrolase [Natronolimnobius sp. AArcel1]
MDMVSHHSRETAYDWVDQGGNGPTLCCIHGSGGRHDVWSSQYHLTDRYPLAAVDLSGHGDSDDIDASAGYSTLSAYADDTLAVVNDTDADVLVGSSLGGAVAVHVLLERSYTPDAVVLTGAGARLGVLEDLLAWLATDFERAVEFLHGEDRFFHQPAPERQAASKDRFYDCGQAVTNRDFRTCHTFDVRDQLEAIEVPVLAVCGEYDQLTPPWYHEFLADEIPAGEYAELEDAAHLVMVEQPTAFNDTVADFLERVC